MQDLKLKHLVVLKHRGRQRQVLALLQFQNAVGPQIPDPESGWAVWEKVKRAKSNDFAKFCWFCWCSVDCGNPRVWDSQIFAESCGNRRFSQETADFYRPVSPISCLPCGAFPTEMGFSTTLKMTPKMIYSGKKVRSWVILSHFPLGHEKSCLSRFNCFAIPRTVAPSAGHNSIRTKNSKLKC